MHVNLLRIMLGPRGAGRPRPPGGRETGEGRRRRSLRRPSPSVSVSRNDPPAGRHFGGSFGPGPPSSGLGRSLHGRLSYSASVSLLLTFQTFLLCRYIFCCSARVSARAPTRPNTPIW